MSEGKKVVMVWDALSDEDAARLARLFKAAPRLLAACEQAGQFVEHALEFFGWGQFPSLHESVEALRDELKAAVAEVNTEAA